MVSCSEYRKRARAALDGSIFSNSWLMLLLVLVIANIVIYLLGFTLIGVLILFGPISIGVASFSLHLVRKTEKQNQFGTLLDGFHGNVGTNILVGILYCLFTFLWSLLFVIPGIVKSIAYSQSYYIALDHPEYDASTCITESRKMMVGHKWKYFCLQLSFIGWYIVGSLCLGIGVLWVEAYREAANTAFYEDISGNGHIADETEAA